MTQPRYDIRPEAATFPKPFPLDRYRRILILAPHPDDEIYGCGGLIALARQRGTEVIALVLTDGDAAEGIAADANPRRAESLAAAERLGHRVAFLGLADRHLRYEAPFIDRIETEIRHWESDLLLAPAPNEPHPDHQAVALTALAAVVRLAQPPDLGFYESGGALTNPTHVVDISAVVAQKQAAMACFVSQEANEPYAKRISARDTFRALTLGPDAVAAEAFQWVSVREQGFAAALALLDNLFLHHRGQAAQPEELPLVSVLIRTVGDPRLEEAVASVLAQSWRPLEIVIVSAHASDIFSRYPHWQNHPLIRQVLPEAPLPRPQAANAALQAARGEYLLFLDEDDLILPEHIATLLGTLQENPPARVSFSQVEVVDASDGTHIRDYACEFARERLLAENLFPIHSVLFHRACAETCRFDERLAVYEGWDFWLQIARTEVFYPTRKRTAVYRYRDRTRLRPLSEKMVQAARRRLRRKWHRQVDSLSRSLEYLANHLNDIERQYARLTVQYKRELTKCQSELQEKTHLSEQYRRELEACHAKLQENARQIAALESQRRELLTSTSWRLTAPLREVKKTLLQFLDRP